jgi:hypothetical protein
LLLSSLSVLLIGAATLRSRRVSVLARK